MYPHAALQTGTVLGVTMETLPASRTKVGLTVFNVPRALLTTLHKGFKMLVLIVVTSKIGTNTHSFRQERRRTSTTCATAPSAGISATPWTCAVSVASAKPWLITRNTDPTE